jgi:large repetitive protein
MLNSVYNEFALTMAPGITTTSLGNGTVGVAYNQTLAASGGISPYNWTLSNGSLPGGLNLSSTGIIAGIPTTAGTSTFIVMATDNTGIKATKTLSIVVNTTPVIRTFSLANGAVGTAYNQTLKGSDGTAVYNWSLIKGSLPGGLNLSPSGIIAGIPATAGTFSFTVMVTDNQGRQAAKALSIIINTAPVINTASLSNGAVGADYSQTLNASGGTLPYNWSLSSGSLPGGLVLSSHGVITGIPATAGTSSFTVMVTDNTGCKVKRTLSLIVNRAPGINTASLVNGMVGVAYSQALNASGGTSPYNWSLNKGSLPGGLTLSSSGIIVGIPAIAGTTNFTVMITDTRGNQATKVLSIIIKAMPVINTFSLVNGAVGADYSQTLNASGGASPYSWSLIRGSLPGGLTLSATGIIAGIPATVGTSIFTIMITDSHGSRATKTLSIITLTSQ